MPNEDNACIRYLMKEMDPSEEVLMERAMMEDEDLLIEVESMRRTLRRIDNNLPLLNPPSHLREQIINEAAQRKPANRPFLPILHLNRFQYAAAAIILAGFISGLIWFQSMPEKNIQVLPQKSSVKVTSSSFVVTPVGETNAEPWIDRNNMLYFQDRFDQTRTAYDSILNSSTQKLKPIDGPLQMNSPTRTLQLTGSEKN